MKAEHRLSVVCVGSSVSAKSSLLSQPRQPETHAEVKMDDKLLSKDVGFETYFA